MDIETAIARVLPRLVSYVLRSGISEAEAEDIVQEAILQGWKPLRSGYRPEHLETWLFRIVHNTLINRRRREDLWRRVLGRYIRPAQGTSEAAGELLEEVRKLPSPYSSILLLRFVHDLTFAEIGEILDIPEATVRVYAGRALEKLHSLWRFQKVKP